MTYSVLSHIQTVLTRILVMSSHANICKVFYKTEHKETETFFYKYVVEWFTLSYRIIHYCTSYSLGAWPIEYCYISWSDLNVDFIYIHCVQAQDLNTILIMSIDSLHFLLSHKYFNKNKLNSLSFNNSFTPNFVDYCDNEMISW